MYRAARLVTAVMFVVVGCRATEDRAGDEESAASAAGSTSPQTAVVAAPAPSASEATTAPVTTATTADRSPTEPADDTTGVSPPSVGVSDASVEPLPAAELEVVVYPVPAGSRPHDVAPALDGGIWYTAQRTGELGYLDVASGATRHIPLGSGSAPHGVIVGPDGSAWITDGGLNAIVRVDPRTDEVTAFPLPSNAPDANLNTAAFDGSGRLWFTGQNGYYGVLDPGSGAIEAYPAPRGRGPYGITATPGGQIYFASLGGSYIGAVAADGSVTEIDPPTPSQGARRVWSDSAGALWVSEWNSGQLSRFDPGSNEWRIWPLPGDDPSAYAVFVDPADQVWVSDFGGNAIHRFNPGTETFDTFALPAEPGEVRQIHGRGGEIWGAQSADDSLVVIRPAA